VRGRDDYDIWAGSDVENALDLHARQRF